MFTSATIIYDGQSTPSPPIRAPSRRDDQSAEYYVTSKELIIVAMIGRQVGTSGIPICVIHMTHDVLLETYDCTKGRRILSSLTRYLRYELTKGRRKLEERISREENFQVVSSGHLQIRC